MSDKISASSQSVTIGDYSSYISNQGKIESSKSYVTDRGSILTSTTPIEEDDFVMTLEELNKQIAFYERAFKMSSEEFWEKRPIEIMESMAGIKWFMFLESRNYYLNK